MFDSADEKSTSDLKEMNTMNEKDEYFSSTKKVMDETEPAQEKINNEENKAKRSRLRKIRISFVALIVISAITFFYDTYMYNEEATRLEEMKKQSRQKKPKPEVETEALPPEKVEPPIKEEPAVPDIPPEPPYESPIDFDYWRSINPDVIGYINIPDTRIDYPILYDKDDNERYLHESIDGKTTVHGSIYLDNLAKPDFTSRNNLIYGHNMKDGTMFKDVIKYKKFDYLKEHQTVYLYTPEREIKLRAIAAFYGTPDGKVRQTIFLDDSEFAKFIAKRLEHAKDLGELPEGGVEGITQLFCLVTCSYEFNNARTFLYCIKESDYEPPVSVVEEPVETVTEDSLPISNLVDSFLKLERH